MSTISVHELARIFGRTEQEVLDDLDAIGVLARDGRSQVPQAVRERLAHRIRERHGRAPSADAGKGGLTNDASDAGAGEWLRLAGPDNAHEAVLVRYSSEESRRILEHLTRSELASGRVPHGGNIGPTVVDHLAKASPFVLEGLRAGRVFKVIGTPALVRGLKEGSMTLMSTSQGALGTVLERSSGRIAGQLRFAQASLTPVMAPLLAVQVFQAIASTAQLSRINARLDMVQRSLERASIRHEAATLGQVRHALRVLDDILEERRSTGTFSPDMLMRLAQVEESIGSVVERNRVLVEELRERLHTLMQSSGKTGAVQTAAFLSEEGRQAAYDMRLLVSVMMADYRVSEARLHYAIEHAPADVERRLEGTRQKSMEYRGVLESLPVLDDVKRHAQACVEEMGWWERSLTARGVVRQVARVGSLPLSDADRHAPDVGTGTHDSYVFWQDQGGQIQVKLLDGGKDAGQH